MRLVEFFKGTERQRVAIEKGKTAKTTLAEGNFNPNQEKRLVRDREQADKLTHTLTVRRKGAVAALALAGLITGLAITNNLNIHPFPQPNYEQASNEALSKYQLDAQTNASLITRVDRGMANLNSVVYSGPADPNVIGPLSSPITFYNANKENPDRNKSQVLLKDLQTRGPKAILQPQVPLPENSSFFYVAPFKQSAGIHGFSGAFSVISQTLEVDPTFDPDNLWDDLIAYHESDHAQQAALFRNSARKLGKEKEYIDSLNKLPNNSIIGFYSESDTYLKQIAMLNIISGGQFNIDSQAPEASLRRYLSLLHARADQGPAVDSLSRIAADAAKMGAKLNNNNFIFAEFINRLYVNAGFDIYDVKDGKLVLAMKHA